jgi:hypothetical protein
MVLAAATRTAVFEFLVEILEIAVCGLRRTSTFELGIPGRAELVTRI